MTKQELKKLLGNNIQLLRLKNNIKQEQLASLIGIAKTNLSRIENGKDFVKASTIVKLCKCLNIRPWELFRENT